MVNEMESLDQSGDSFKDEDSDFDDDESDNNGKDWVSVLYDDDHDDYDDDESLGDWANLDTMRSSHPIVFAKQLTDVESYLKIVDESKLPSAFFQVKCWVLGEYGTADGKYFASYISGKLCDVAEAHSSDDIVKGYAVTALMKVFAFGKAAGRKFSLLSTLFIYLYILQI